MGWLENKPYENIFDEGSSTQDFTKDHQTSVSLTFKKPLLKDSPVVINVNHFSKYEVGRVIAKVINNLEVLKALQTLDSNQSHAYLVYR